jgi:DNA mismatch repair ATPase MutL
MQQEQVSVREIDPLTFAQSKKEKKETSTVEEVKQVKPQRTDRRRRSLDTQEDLEKQANASLQPYSSLVLNSAFSSIEGYMLKRIDAKQFYHVNQFHLRYFRIIFQSNVMIVKSDKADRKVTKEISLSELTKVEYLSIVPLE